ncbi:MAG: chemotaxis protein CheB [Lachnospiraceae bacterium]|nr:chemotaxis protein CheB [Lachnospiraceae bacterium]
MYNQKTSKAPVRMQPNCVVGIGASAGGLEALQQFLTFLPSNTGMAFVIIQHLAPDHKSLLAEILGKYSAMPVTEIRDGMYVERNHIYMIPPKYNVEITSGVLHLRDYDSQKINHPIDVFFRSLAAAYENRAVAVILSGTGSDGTNGIRSIKEQNGVIIVQSPDSAKFDGMPRSAISTGFVDLIQKPDSIAKEMVHIAASMVDSTAKLQLSDHDLMDQVFSILRNVTNINYTYYKQTTILRRIERRLVITHNRNLQEYVSYLTNNPDEAKLLAKEVLIGVTSFFRDPEYFAVLKETVVKPMLKEAAAVDRQIRIWIAGCSTGEEAYSIAILYAEAMEDLNLHVDIKIFATDLDAESISTAVRGIYGDNIIEDVSVNRLSKYFTRKGNKYIIHHDIRKMIIFAQHNVFQDPPFGKLDLISCRNVLIYFQSVLQRNLFSIFHMALNDHGYLFLGRSESVIDYDDIFRVHCANEKIFIHNASGNAPTHQHISYSMQNVESNLEPVNVEGYEEDVDVQYKASELDISVLEQLMPACVLVDDKNELARSFGNSAQFLSIPAGVATLDIFSLLRTDLKIAVSTALRDARSTGTKVSYDAVPVQLEGKPEYISIVAEPIMDRYGAATKFTAISFLRGKREVTDDMKKYQIDTAAAKRISNLEQELKITKDSLRQTVTELESVNAELQAANEELLTANEELQSSNEELQSVNEELYTVNSEYQTKVTELAAVNDDMANFLSTTLVGVLMVDRDLNIRKYTEYVASEFNVADQDVGRSLRYINYNFEGTDLIAECRHVLETMVPLETNCVSSSGKTYLVRIAPYRVAESGSFSDESGVYEEITSVKRVKGLVLTFMDTTRQMDDQEQIEQMSAALRVAVESGKEKEAFLSHMSHDMRTPMTAIFGLTELTLKEDLSPSVRDNLEKIQTSSEYLLELIEEILETSRINAGKVVSVSSAVKEDTVMNTVAAIVEERAKAHGQNFTLNAEGCKNKYVLMDAPHVERILINLLSNSLKYTTAQGSISLDVKFTYEDDYARHIYTIQDTGSGISPSFQSRMFRPFEQDNSHDQIHDGTGLGLYIVKNLVDLLDGEITWSSTVGEGTTFVVTLSFPFATQEQVALQNVNRASTFEDQVLYGKNVLIAEDNRLIAEIVMKILNTKGIHSELASDGQEAVDLFSTQKPYHYQAVLMDLMMPVKNGEEASREIRAMKGDYAKKIPIIALTADVTGHEEERCRECGMNRYITKPIDPPKLFSALADEMVKSLHLKDDEPEEQTEKQ